MTPQRFRISTTVAEKPHCGNCGVPFMYSTTRLLRDLLANRVLDVLMAVAPAGYKTSILRASAGARPRMQRRPRSYSLTAPVSPDT